MIGQTISHYRILEKLGAGGMGVVYKAQDLRLDRAVALKFLPDNLLHDAIALERFRREVQAASALNHPGICTIYDAGEDEGKPFIAMEFIDGEALSQFIHGKPLGTEQILTLGIQLADALSVAHGQGIIHRDIKPANIYVTRRGQAKVLDFGLAKLLQKTGTIGGEPRDPLSSTETSIVGVISGTPSYMSPEQIRGDDLDARTDVFSLGLLLYEMATGQKAFSGNTGGAVIEAILTRVPTSIRSVNADFPEDLEAVINKAINKDVTQRYQSAAELCADLQAVKRGLDTGHTVASLIRPAVKAADAQAAIAKYKWAAIGAFGTAAVLLGLGAWLVTSRKTHALEETDTIVVADFTNKTGDAVFDDTLRQGLSAGLQQSPFLNLLSEQRIEQTLQLMGKTPDTKMTPEVARELCTRAGSKAYLSGSISNLGSEYVIGINAVNCQTGDSLARQQVTADSKEGVLKALDSATIKLRETLGESLKTIHKLDMPIEEATTPSLEALQAYSLGRKMMLGKGDYAAAVPMFERAIALDPRFAMAYASLGTCYHNIGERNLAEQNTEHSYTLRGQVSGWEKFYIESHYYHFVTGDLEKAKQVYELWGQTYPRDGVPPQNLGSIYQYMGQYDKSLTQTQEAVRLAPSSAGPFSNLVEGYTRLNRFGDARTAADDAAVRKLESPALHFDNYNLGFLQHDSEGMAKEGTWAASKPANANVMLYLVAEEAGYTGQADKARGLSREAVQASLRAREKENAARCQAASALREATYGNVAEARRAGTSALELTRGRDEQYLVGLALAMVGETTSAQSLADDLAKSYPRDTIVQFNYLPTLRAQILLGKSMMARSDAASAKDAARKAVEELQAATPYEFGTPGDSAFTIGGYPIYVRGAAYLAAGQGAEAVTEFQKLVEHPGVTLTESIGALAYLGLARGYALSGDAARAKAAYDNFFQLWKVADADLPILKAARAEYGKLG